jgi:hypothetical protein
MAGRRAEWEDEDNPLSLTRAAFPRIAALSLIAACPLEFLRHLLMCTCTCSARPLTSEIPPAQDARAGAASSSSLRMSRRRAPWPACRTPSSTAAPSSSARTATDQPCSHPPWPGRVGPGHSVLVRHGRRPSYVFFSSKTVVGGRAGQWAGFKGPPPSYPLMLPNIPQTKCSRSLSLFPVLDLAGGRASRPSGRSSPRRAIDCN